MGGFDLLRHCCYTFVVILSIHITVGDSLSFNLDFSMSDHASCITYSNDSFWAKPMVELTSGDINKSSVGRVWFAHPVPLWDPATRELASFSTNFSFQISKSSDDEVSWGDGMAFFLSHYPSVTPTNSDGGGLGLMSRSSDGRDPGRASGDEQFVAIEFDTFQNPWEHSGDHVGIDINSIASSDAYKDTDEAGKNLSSGLPMTATVSYHNDTMLLSVDLQIDDAPFHVSTYVDLRDHLPQVVAVGFSASTGRSVELHQLLSWSFDSSDLVAPKKPAATGKGNNNATYAATSAAAAAAATPAAAPQQTHEAARGLRPERLALIAVCGLLGLVLSMVAAFALWKTFNWCQQKRERKSQRCRPKQYQHHKLFKATNGFDKRRKLGRGGSGEVYLGDDNGRPIAVKKLINTGVAGEEALRRTEFETEVNIISRRRHRNLVRLIGWCDSTNDLLLVYEYISGGSLDKHLGPDGSLTWNDRFRVIIDLAKAICYLHGEHSDANYVVHGDIKPSNIMLDEKLSAKLGDFGVARLVEHGAEPRTTRYAMGTKGYIEPEFVETKKKCRESDVYSFGIVLLEIVTDSQPTIEQFRDRVWKLYERNRVIEAASGKLRSECSDRQMERVLKVGLWCTQQARIERPSITEALRVLENADSQLPVLRPCNGRLAALSAVSESPAHRRVTSSILGEMALVPSQMYFSTAPAASGAKETYRSGISTAPEASTQPSSSNSSTGYTTCSSGALATKSIGLVQTATGGNGRNT